MSDHIIIHYNEIGLKGRNRPWFEKQLVQNIEKALADCDIAVVKKIYGRVLVKLGIKADVEQVKLRLKQVCGIANFSLATLVEADIKNIKKDSLAVLKKCKFETFRVTARRSDKNFSLNSQQVNEQVGEHILESIKGVNVDLENSDSTLHIEITDRGAFLYTEKIRGVGGLPVGVSGKVVSLLSAGFDSPVASFRLLKRGARVIFIHFHAYPQTSKESIANVKKLVTILNNYQFEAKLYLIPFLNIQKEISKVATADRVILYRRLMVRIAQKIADREGAQALVTGDSLGQVASQTLENLRAVSAVAMLPILRPLIGMDKEEIMNEARDIGTYDISSQPYEDCCSVFIPQNPTIKADIGKIEEQEKQLNIDSLVEKALESGKMELIANLKNKCSK